MGSPSNRIAPDVISISPVIIFMVVDLPEPFGPRYPVISPARAEKLTSSTATMPLNRFEMLRSSSMALLQTSKESAHLVQHVPLVRQKKEMICIRYPHDTR